MFTFDCWFDSVTDICHQLDCMWGSWQLLFTRRKVCCTGSLLDQCLCKPLCNRETLERATDVLEPVWRLHRVKLAHGYFWRKYTLKATIITFSSIGWNSTCMYTYYVVIGLANLFCLHFSLLMKHICKRVTLQ